MTVNANILTNPPPTEMDLLEGVGIETDGKAICPYCFELAEVVEWKGIRIIKCDQMPQDEWICAK